MAFLQAMFAYSAVKSDIIPLGMVALCFSVLGIFRLYPSFRIAFMHKKRSTKIA